jgi:hypothetical protein
MHLRLQPLPSITSRPAPQLSVSFPALESGPSLHPSYQIQLTALLGSLAHN